jgi:hypothetical protein
MLFLVARYLLTEELLDLKAPHIISPAKDGIFDIPILQHSIIPCTRQKTASLENPPNFSKL